MTVRCKMRLVEIHNYISSDSQKFVFRPEYDTNIPEDQRFALYSPMGEFWILVANPAVQASYKLGSYYYFDSIEIPQLPAVSPTVSVTA